MYPLLGVAFFPRTDPGQFVINVKAPTGSRLEMTNQYVARVENDIRDVVGKDDLQMIVSNIGLTPDLSSIYTSNSGQHTAFVQVSLRQDHKLSTFAYMDRVRQKLASDLPEVSTYFLRPAAWWIRWSIRACLRPSTSRSAATISMPLMPWPAKWPGSCDPCTT